MDEDACAAQTGISLQEHRRSTGLDRHVPVIVRDGAVYDSHLDRFFLDLPLNGVRSPHSLRAYGYDVVVWVRFLEEACGKSVWMAERPDVAAFHRARRREDAGTRISAASWNRSVAALDKLYRWAEAEGLVASSPFTHRDVWQRGQGARRARVVARNDSYECAAKRSEVHFISLADYRVFRDVGLRGLTADGAERPGAKDRNATRNALFADVLVTTGLRLEEASFLLAAELMALAQSGRGHQAWLVLPAALTKGDRGRSVLLPRRLIQDVTNYVGVERAHAVCKFRAREGWRAMHQPIFVRRPVPGARGLALRDGGMIPIDSLGPDERSRLVICGKDGRPTESGVLWLTETGQPVRPNSWEAAFARACRRCNEAGFPIRVSPHQLRHAFAVHMLAMLIQHRLRDAALDAEEPGKESYRRLLGDPLQQVQRLLGHASLTTTYLYLDHLAARADTVDAAVEALLALVPSGRTA